MEKLFEIENGNAIVTLYEDGTRVVETDDDFLDLKQPLSLDINISNRCYNNCPYCYANNTPQGKVADLSDIDYLEDISGIEIAINLQFPLPPYFEQFLKQMKEQNIVVSGTVNQIDLERDIEVLKYLRKLQREDLIKGIGISYRGTNTELEDLIYNNLNNVVIHTIVGITPTATVKRLLSRGFKVLILGYKTKGRGQDYLPNTDIENWKKEIKDILRYNHHSVLSFDTCAVNQLSIKDLMNKDDWDKYYQGDEGTISFYIDAVNRTFNIDSHILEEPFNIDDIKPKKKSKILEQMFEIIKNKTYNNKEEG